MSPEYVRPYVKAQKNDDRDAEAIAEAATRPILRFVEIESEAQLDMQTLHRARDRRVGERTALINQLRTILIERGIIVPQGRRKLEQHLATMLDQAGATTLALRVTALIEDRRQEWRELDRRIGTFNEEFAVRAREDDTTRSVAHGCVVHGPARQERLQQPRRLAIGMPRAQLRLKPPELGRASVRQQGQEDIHKAPHIPAGAGADTRRVNGDGPKQRLDLAGPQITLTSRLEAVSAHTSARGEFLDPGLKDQASEFASPILSLRQRQAHFPCR
jgi:Transposase